MRKRYDKTLHYTKKQLWRDWLEKAEEPDIWTANRYTSALASDGGKTRIPTLRGVLDGNEVMARSNGEKSTMLAKRFFPLRPRLLRIYEAMYEHGLMYGPWKSFTTVVLRKPGKTEIRCT